MLPRVSRQWSYQPARGAGFIIGSLEQDPDNPFKSLGQENYTLMNEFSFFLSFLICDNLLWDNEKWI